MRLINHIDGKWYTSYHEFDGHKLEIKMRPDHGCKIHVWDKENMKVIKTFRYNFVTDTTLLLKAKEWLQKQSKKGGNNE